VPVFKAVDDFLDYPFVSAGRDCPVKIYPFPAALAAERRGVRDYILYARLADKIVKACRLKFLPADQAAQGINYSGYGLNHRWYHRKTSITTKNPLVKCLTGFLLRGKIKLVAKFSFCHCPA